LRSEFRLCCNTPRSDVPKCGLSQHGLNRAPRIAEQPGRGAADSARREHLPGAEERRTLEA
jgi:hypothetical protein